MNVAEYWINQAQEKAHCKSTRQLSLLIGTHTSLISDIKQGRTRMPFHMCQKIAAITGADEAAILISIMADKAKDQEERAALFQLIQRANPETYANLSKASECLLC
jgi:transcriptional regulator with XRE-family HTH domain